MRVALVTNFCPYYRRPLFQEMCRRMDMTLMLTSQGREWYWQGHRPSDVAGVQTVDASSPLKVIRELQTGGYDAVVSDLTGRATLLAAVRMARALDVPLVLWIGIWEHPRTVVHRVSRMLARNLYRSADAIVTYGSHVSSYVAKEAGRTERVFIAPQAVENDRFRASVPEEEIKALRIRLNLLERPTLTFVGRVTEEKGLDVLMEASARVRAPHQVVVAGTGPLLEATMSRASALGIGERVRFVGHVDQAELPVLLNASDALVVPSVSTKRFREPWGLVANEAMNCSLPVIATDAVGAAAGGLVVHERTGLVVPQRDADALASAMNELAANAPKRHGLGENAVDYVLAWNYTAAADAFDAALAAAMGNRR